MLLFSEHCQQAVEVLVLEVSVFATWLLGATGYAKAGWEAATVPVSSDGSS